MSKAVTTLFAVKSTKLNVVSDIKEVWQGLGEEADSDYDSDTTMIFWIPHDPKSSQFCIIFCHCCGNYKHSFTNYPYHIRRADKVLCTCPDGYISENDSFLDSDDSDDDIDLLVWSRCSRISKKFH